MATIKIGGAALNQTPMDWDGNLAHILEAIDQGRRTAIDMLCLPELCITGYGCEDWFLSDWVSETAIAMLPAIASACKNITVVVGLPIAFKGKMYNCCCIIQNEEILGITAKQHMAIDGVHYEARWFSPWNANVVDVIEIDGIMYPFGDIVYRIEGYSVGFEICEDAWRADTRPAHRLLEQDVQIIMNPSASHFALGKSILRDNLVTSSSKKFNCVYVYANLLGNEAGRMIYDGEILIAQKGKLIAKNNLLSFRDVNIVAAEVDVSEPFLSIGTKVLEDQGKDRDFTAASTLALFDYMRKSRSRGFVLSLSGGADSSCCAILVAEMIKRGTEELGFELFLQKLGRADLIALVAAKDTSQNKRKFITGHILTTAYQATSNSSPETERSALELAASLGATFHRWNIDEEVTGYIEKTSTALQRKLTWEKDDITLQNIQARARSPIIWMFANIHNALLLTTSNRSEGDVGYTTMDGDTSGSIAPIAAVDKYFIINWLKWAEVALDYEALQYVNSLTPTAELRPPENTQTDESDLMPYGILKDIEVLAIRNKKSPVAVFQAMKKSHAGNEAMLRGYIQKFFKLWARNQWKRERIAPSFHLDDFNIDPRTWCRFPILSGGFEKELEELRRL